MRTLSTFLLGSFALSLAVACSSEGRSDKGHVDDDLNLGGAGNTGGSFAAGGSTIGTGGGNGSGTGGEYKLPDGYTAADKGGWKLDATELSAGGGSSTGGSSSAGCGSEIAGIV